MYKCLILGHCELSTDTKIFIEQGCVCSKASENQQGREEPQGQGPGETRAWECEQGV
jgi:hypothetical protein